MIDDDVLLGRMVQRALATEHVLLIVEHAQDALNFITAGERFDLVLCDLMLPGVTGMDFFERVGPIAPELVERIVFITGGAYTTQATAFLARADIRHVEKPFPSVNSLRAMVRAQLARAGRR